MHGSLPKACPHSGPVPLRPHTHIAPGLDAVQNANFGRGVSHRARSAVVERQAYDWKVWCRVTAWGPFASLASLFFLLFFGTSSLQPFCVPVCNSYVLHSNALSFVLWHIIFAAFSCARLQLLCFAFLLFHACSLRFYVFYVRRNISANRAGVIRFCCR